VKPTPPQYHGERLATFPRGPGKEVRVEFGHYAGEDYLGIRLWDDGWRTVMGVSLKTGELTPLIDVLTGVARRTGRLEPPPEASSPVTIDPPPRYDP
jgi:hypothetical protein